MEKKCFIGITINKIQDDSTLRKEKDYIHTFNEKTLMGPSFDVVGTGYLMKMAFESPNI